MAQAKGSKAQILFQKETTFGSSPAASAQILPFVSETFRLQRNLVESAAITGVRNIQMPRRGAYNVSGTIELEMNGFMHHVLYGAFGACTTSACGSYFKHLLTVSDLPSFIIEKKLDFTSSQVYYLYNGCKLNRFSMNLTPEGMIRASADFMGTKETSGTSTFGTAICCSGHQPFDAFECTIKEGGSTLGVVTALDIAIENNLDGNIYVIDGTGQRKDIPEGFCRVTGTLRAMFQDSALYSKALNHTESMLEIVLTKGAGTGASGAEKMTFYVPELVYSPQTPAVPGPQGIIIELPFTAYYGDDTTGATKFGGSGSSSIWCEVLNSRPTAGTTP